MDKKIIGILLIALIAIVTTASLSYYISSQPNQTPNVPSSTPTPTSSPSEEPTEPASIPQPSVPEFTVDLVDTSYDVPTTYSTDPYTGDTVTHEGYHVNRRTIVVKIKNQPFTPYTDSDGRNIKFYYNIRIKGAFEEWDELDTVYNAELMPTQSNSEYTVIEYDSQGEYTFILSKMAKSLEVTPNGRVDFQVQALVGYTRDTLLGAGWHGWVFTGEKSDWSNTQTITIP